MAIPCNVALRQIGEEWEFISEAALEDFVWANLTALFGLTPLKQQHHANGEYCDILAVNAEKQLVILELKNSEDRYIVQQLTRYYANLLETQPFKERVDYTKGIKLIAVAPSFHRHNLIDRNYNKLHIDFWPYKIQGLNGCLFFQVRELDTDRSFQVELVYQPVNCVTKEELSEPPAILLTWLGACTNDERSAIFKMREKILSFDKRLKENSDDKNCIQYGKGKNKCCAEFLWKRTLRKPVLFLWLPIPKMLSTRQTIGRMRIWIDGENVSYVGHVPKGFGQMRPWAEWEQLPDSKRPHFAVRQISFNSSSLVAIPTFTYFNILNSKGGFTIASRLNVLYGKEKTNPISLDVLVDLALTNWLTRI